MAKKAKGKKPTFFADPQVDKLMAIVVALAGEVSVLRERLDTVERVAESKGLLSRQEIEAYRPAEPAAEEREQWRSQYLARILRVVHEELDAVERGETTPESYEAVVQAVSS
jgi:IS5 family transposase